MIKNFRFTFLNIISVLCVLYGIGTMILFGYHFGVLAILAIGGFAAFFSYCGAKNIKNRYITILKIAVITGLLCVSALIILICFMPGVPYSNKDEDAVIVLGCGLEGSEVSDTLKERLDACLLYIEENPKAIIVVSGGQGFNEDIPEALAMEKYLVDHNVPKDKIIKESESSSTYENFINSKKILDKIYDGKKDSYTTAFITNRFHCYRSYNLAKNAGIDSMCFPAPDEWKSVIVSYLREAPAVVKLWVLGI